MADQVGRVESMYQCVQIVMDSKFNKDFEEFDYLKDGELPALNRTLITMSKKHKLNLLGFLLAKAIKRVGSIRLLKILKAASEYENDEGSLFVTKYSSKSSHGYMHHLGLTIDHKVVNYANKFELKSPRVHILKALFIAALTDEDTQRIPALIAMDEWFNMSENQSLHIDSLYSKPDTWYE